MNKKLLFVLGIGLCFNVFAKEILTTEYLQEIKQLGKIDKLRVYLSKKLTTYQEEIVDSSTDVNDSVTTSVEKNVVRTIITTEIKGLIIDVVGNPYRVYVSFDPSCNSKECAYMFSHMRDFNGSHFYLSRIPEKNNYKLDSAKVGNGFLFMPFLRSEHLFKIKLKLKKSESEKIIKTTERPQGFDI